MGFVIQKFMEWKIQAQSLSNSFPDNVSSIYRRSHDLIIGGSIATINFTRSFPPFLPTLFSFLLFFSLLFPRFRWSRKRARKNFSRNGKNVVRQTQGTSKLPRGFVTKQRGGNFCGWLCGINEKSRRWSKDEDLNFFFLIERKYGRESKRRIFGSYNYREDRKVFWPKIDYFFRRRDLKYFKLLIFLRGENYSDFCVTMLKKILI